MAGCLRHLFWSAQVKGKQECVHKFGGDSLWRKSVWSQLDDNIKVDFRQIVCEDVKWMELAQWHVEGNTSINSVNLLIFLPECQLFIYFTSEWNIFIASFW
jgi:hypothetical protein